MNNRTLTPQMLAANLGEFQDVLYLDPDRVLNNQPDFSAEQIGWINNYLRHMTDMFGLALVHCLGMDVHEGHDLLETSVSQMPAQLRAEVEAEMQKDLDKAYDDYLENTKLSQH